MLSMTPMTMCWPRLCHGFTPLQTFYLGLMTPPATLNSKLRRFLMFACFCLPSSRDICFATPRRIGLTWYLRLKERTYPYWTIIQVFWTHTTNSFLLRPDIFGPFDLHTLAQTTGFPKPTRNCIFKLVLLPSKKNSGVWPSSHNVFVTLLIVLVTANIPKPQKEASRRSLSAIHAANVLSWVCTCRSFTFCCCMLIFMVLTSIPCWPRESVIIWNRCWNSTLVSTLPETTCSSRNTWPYHLRCLTALSALSYILAH